MNVSIVTQWFPPEHAPIGYMCKELAEQLTSQGHEVTVVTAFPNHPAGVVFPGYRKSLLQEERLGRVRILRTWLFTSRSRSLLSRVLTFLSFTLTSCWVLLRHTRPGLILASFQPLTLGLTLPLVARLKGSRLVLNVQDLHPDAIVSTGTLTNRWVIAVLRRLEAFGYRHARGLVVISEGFREHVIERGASSDRIAVIENWIDTDALTPGDRHNEVRAELGGSRDSFIVLYAGTIGLASGADMVVDAAKLLSTEQDILFAFVGDGHLVATLKQRAESADLENIAFLPFQPRDRLPLVQASCDVGVVSLLAGHGRISVPSKVLGYMAAGRAVIASVDTDSDTARLLRQAACGVVVPPGDAERLAEAILALRNDRPWLVKLGQTGREYAVTNFSKRAATRRYSEFLTSVAAGE